MSMNVFERAQHFVGNPGEDYFTVGRLQLELLMQNGLRPESRVLEIGCGCLVAGRQIMKHLNAERYVGIEPNPWLIEAVLEGLPDTRALIDEKRPRFLHNLEFDASSAGVLFDFVISHSILSHAAEWQCPQLFRGVKSVLAPEGVAVISLRFFDDNNQLAGDSHSPEWVYPGCSFFSWETIRKCAAEAGLYVEWRQDYREFFTASAPSNYHDWIRLTHA